MILKIICSLFIISLYLFSISFINAQEPVGCPDSYCPKIKCRELSCKGSDQKLLANSSKCGCCDQCIKILDENEECLVHKQGSVPETECGEHLVCLFDNKKAKSFCRPMTTDCEQKRAIVIESMSELTTGPPIPTCTDTGLYAPKQCKNGTLCHCVGENGLRIFGTSSYAESEDMNCLCSRQYSELGYGIKPYEFIRCQENGNFEPFQNAVNHSYCVDVESGEMKELPVTKEKKQQLSCFSDKYSFNTSCIESYLVALAVKKELETKSIVVGFDLPNCDLDGSYAPVQCVNDHCYCVNKKGEKYKDTTVLRNSKKAEDQLCNCVRELEIIRDTKEKDQITSIFAQYQCSSNGNYAKIQCAESVCYCVNSYGYQEGESVLESRKHELEAKC